jgi:hypothetical protein
LPRFAAVAGCCTSLRVVSTPNLGFIGIVEDSEGVACALCVEVVILRGTGGVEDTEVVEVVEGVSCEEGGQSDASLP